MGDDYAFSYLVVGDEHLQAPLSETYSVFARPASRRDKRARSWAKRPPIPPGRFTLVTESARLLLSDAGLPGQDLVAAPTTEGSIFIALAPDGPGSCGRPMAFGLKFAGVKQGSKLVVYGIVGDEVRAVDVVVAGADGHARIGENGFVCEFSDVGKEDVELLRLHLAGGGVEVIRLA